ncbi:MAG: NADPH-dependent glutamate synthase [Melioribacteraceae bacterium]|jgi:glutamate synthase (NADPH/NADH) small chain|nr:NADPH-dependent glutamate synthase [Melioribacteraceae bacterium]
MSHPSQAEINEQVKILFDEIFNRETPITKKQQLAIPPQMMPAQDENIRRHNLDEVAVGYSAEQARVEAMRCIQCAKPACIADCPVEINIPGFIKHIADNDFQSAIDVIKETSLLPSICGRVCPQETQCQLHCATGKFYKDVDKAVAIGRLERFVADWEREQGTITPPEAKPETGKKVAIVGSGPAGLVVAADVRREGHDVTLFEAFHKLGGVMRYGIPEFRLPNTIIDQEVSTLTKMGVKFQKNYVVGRTRKLLDLMKKDGFDSVFIGTGAGLPMFMGIEGENLVGVFSANEYLTRANLMKAYDEENSATPFYHSKNVAVLGGGNVAMDSARMALRLGAENVYVVYRRTEKEMPARVEEVEHAKEEGVQFLFLQNAKSIKGNDNSRVSGMECLRYELGEPDASGRRRPIVIEGSEFMLDLDTVIVAIGNGSNPLVSQTTPELDVNKWGNLIVDEKMKTSVDGVYAGGDIVLGAATVILAMGEGRKAAAAINEHLT